MSAKYNSLQMEAYFFTFQFQLLIELLRTSNLKYSCIHANLFIWLQNIYILLALGAAAAAGKSDHLSSKYRFKDFQLAVGPAQSSEPNRLQKTRGGCPTQTHKRLPNFTCLDCSSRKGLRPSSGPLWPGLFGLFVLFAFWLIAASYSAQIEWPTAAAQTRPVEPVKNDK